MHADTAPAAVSALLLCGGQGRRMGGQDKGLLTLQGRPIVEWVLQAIRPQVGPILISANRHLDRYAALGLPVLSDAVSPDDPAARIGPLAGMLAGLQACTTPWLQCLPCDCPAPPPDLVARLLAAAQAASNRADTPTDQPAKRPLAAVPLSWQDEEGLTGPDGRPRMQPTFALLHRDAADSLARYIASGGRRVGQWLQTLDLRPLPFDRPADAHAFDNLNTPEDWQRFDAAPPRPTPT